MKTITRFMMLSVFYLCASQHSFGQNQEQATASNQIVLYPVAQVNIQTGPTNATCTFISNAEIPEWKAVRLKERIESTYTEVISIDIDAQTQEVVLIVASEDTDIALTKIVRHFKYHSYVQE